MPNARFLRRASIVVALLTACATSAPPPERQSAPPVAPQSAAPTPAPPLRSASAAAAAQQPSSPSVLPPDSLTGPAADRVAELARKAAPLVADAFLNSNGLFTRDGKGVLLLSNRDGLPQLYVADATRPDSQARRLVESQERVRLDTTTPEGKAVLFGSDHGADEKWSIWRVNLDGSSAVELTPGERIQRDRAHLPDLAGQTVYYSARRMNDASTAVYAASTLEPGQERELYRDSKPGFLTDVSRDGKRALFRRIPSISENYLLLLDLASALRVLH